jgi:hypothetical protein
VHLTNLTLLGKRMVSKDKLCFFTASDRVSLGARVTLRIARGSGPGELPTAAAAAAIRACKIGAVVASVQGVLSTQWSRQDGAAVLSCDIIEVDRDGSGDGPAGVALTEGVPTLLFDLNYANEMTADEFSGLCRQLRLCYSANRRSAHAFRICLAGAGILPPQGAEAEAER